MAFIKAQTIGDMVGKWATLTRDVSVLAGTFEKGTRVKITGVDWMGTSLVFSFEDEEGNKAHDIIGNSFKMEE